jgi:hypothetical protein
MVRLSSPTAASSPLLNSPPTSKTPPGTMAPVKKRKSRGALGLISDYFFDVTDNDTQFANLKKHREAVNKIFEDGMSSNVTLADSLVNIVVIGGGPVGLWTAVQIKIRKRSKTNIVVLEKYEEYRRSHVVIIDPSSLADMASHPVLNQIAEDLNANSKIRTNDIENRLVGLAKELGIRIIKPDFVADPKTLRQRFPNVSVVIGADGSHSTVRQTLFNDEMRYRENLQYLIEVKYECEGPTKKLTSSSEGFKTMQMIECIVTEVVGKETEGYTPVTFRLIITKDMYEASKEATFKSPFRLPTDESKVHPDLLFKIKIWLNAKRVFMNEKVVEGSLKITATKLDMYAARSFVRGDGDAHVCLVGDAAFGVPFFRSMNNGLLCGTRLSIEIASYINTRGQCENRTSDSVQGMVASQFVAYGRYAKRLSKTEKIVAQTKSSGLNVANWGTSLTSRAPWQTTKWSHEEIDNLYSEELSLQEDEATEGRLRTLSFASINRRNTAFKRKLLSPKVEEPTYVLRTRKEIPCTECGTVEMMEYKGDGSLCSKCGNSEQPELCELHPEQPLDVYNCSNGTMFCMKCLLAATPGKLVFTNDKKCPNAPTLMKMGEAMLDVDKAVQKLKENHHVLEKNIADDWDKMIEMMQARKKQMIEESKLVLGEKLNSLMAQKKEINSVADDLRIHLEKSEPNSVSVDTRIRANVNTTYSLIDISLLEDTIKSLGQIDEYDSEMMASPASEIDTLSQPVIQEEPPTEEDTDAELPVTGVEQAEDTDSTDVVTEEPIMTNVEQNCE